jgi:cysteine desulfurase family protein (TIGR01976 family)
MRYDLDKVRADFPALADGTASFDGPGGSQTPRQVAEAVAATLSSGISNRGSVTASERHAAEIVVEARAAVGDLLGCDARGVVFGRSMTQLTFDISRTLARQWGPGDEVVVTRLDHDADIRPWLTAAAAAGAKVRWLEFDPESGELDFDAGLVSGATRLVAVTGASNLLGTRPDLAAIATAAHEAGALLFVDGVHLTAHAPVDVPQMGADVFVCSPYKFFGPHLGVLAADPAVLETLHPDKLLASTDEVPERFELGTLPYEMLAGVTAAIEFIASLASDASDRRTRVVESMTRVEEHEHRMFQRLLEGLDRIDGVRRYGRPLRRTPTVLFDVEGHTGDEIHRHLAAQGVNAPAGSFYAIEASRHLGLGDAGGVRAGIAPYTSEDDVDRLVSALSKL